MADQIEAKLEACPKADQVHKPLMDEYLTMLGVPGKQVTPLGLNKPGGDLYELAQGDKQMYILVGKGKDYTDKNNVLALDKFENNHRIADEYQDGVRTRAQDTLVDSTTGHSTVKRSEFSPDGQRVVAATGDIYDWNSPQQEVGRFTAKFGANGKLTEYKLAPFRTFDVVINKCAE